MFVKVLILVLFVITPSLTKIHVSSPKLQHPFISKQRLLDIEKRVQSKLKDMTNIQKARQLDMWAGVDFLTNGTLDIEKSTNILENGIGVIHDFYPPTADFSNRLQEIALNNGPKIPILFLEECLHGLNQADHTIFPNPTALGSTFDVELVQQVAAAISTETRAYGIRQCLSPVLGAAREPRWGRVEELFGEDAIFISQFARAYVIGMQGKNVNNMSVVSEPKHFAAHSIPEGGSNTAVSHVGRRELEESFLPQFEAAVSDGGALGMMSAYSEIDGVPCSASSFLLTQKLRTEWGFLGYVLSDLGAIHMLEETHRITQYASGAITAYLTAGGNMQFYDYPHDVFQNAIVEGVANGTLPQTVLDARVADVLRVKFMLELFDSPYTPLDWVKRDNNSPEHQKLALRAARESIILLKNYEKMLPLSVNVSAIALIGMCAFEPQLADYSGTGGNNNNWNSVTLLQGLHDFLDAAQSSTEIITAWGTGIQLDIEYIPIHRTHLSLSPSSSNRRTAEQGLKGEYFNNMELSGTPALVRIDPEVNFAWYHWGFNASNGGPDYFSARWTGYLTPDVSMDNASLFLSFKVGGARLSVNNQLIINAWNCSSIQCSYTADISLEKFVSYSITVEYWKSSGDSSFQWKWNLIGKNGMANAIAAAEEAKSKGGIAIVAVGDDTSSSGEGHDRTDLTLPGKQEQLVESIIGTGITTLVVLFSGRSVVIPWIADRATAIIEAFDPGQSGGTALAEVIFGAYNPAGRLPLSFPARTGQIPIFYNYKPSSRHGYIDVSPDPIYAFGEGLSYTVFSYSSLTIDPSIITSRTVSQVVVSCKVTNIGDMDGDEVAQMYVRDEVSSVTTPVKQLRGFARQFINAGDSASFTFTLNVPKDLAVFTVDNTWMMENGKFTIMIGSTSRDIQLVGELMVDIP